MIDFSSSCSEDFLSVLLQRLLHIFSCVLSTCKDHRTKTNEVSQLKVEFWDIFASAPPVETSLMGGTGGCMLGGSEDDLCLPIRSMGAGFQPLDAGDWPLPPRPDSWTVRKGAGGEEEEGN